MKRHERLISVTVLLLAWLLAGGCDESSGDGDSGIECPDEADPCPNDMVTDESGCVWDRCGGGFTGKRIPCFWTDPEIDRGEMEFAGDHGQYLAYIEKKEEYVYKGDVWLYDIELQERRRLTQDRLCYNLRAGGNRLGWLQLVKESEHYHDTDVVDAYVMDLESGQEWHVPNPLERQTVDLDMSGNLVITREMWMTTACPLGGKEIVRDLWLYDLTSGERRQVAAADPQSHVILGGRIADGMITYWKMTGPCADSVVNQLWVEDAAGEESRMLADTGNERPFAQSEYSFSFDGRWLVQLFGSYIDAFDVRSGESKRITRCSMSDCRLRGDAGLVAFDRYGEDGLTQRQVYVVEIETSKEQRVTDLRPYYDSSAPSGMVGNRLLWAERRGKNTIDDCGFEHRATGWTSMYFWKEIVF